MPPLARSGYCPSVQSSGDRGIDRPDCGSPALHLTHQGALAANLEAPITREAIIGLLQGVGTGEIAPWQGVRLLRYRAVLIAEVPAFVALSRQAAADLRHCRPSVVRRDLWLFPGSALPDR